jgi:translation initiation factor 3 subunit J
MSDTWDDSDDDWDNDDDDLDARLNKVGISKNETPAFDDEEDLAMKEKEESDKQQHVELRKKGNALAAKKKAELERKEEEELARKTMELEAEMEANLSPDELRAMKQRQIEEADNALTDDLFGGVDNQESTANSGTAATADDAVVLKDLKDHLKHARKVATAMKVSTMML